MSFGTTFADAAAEMEGEEGVEGEKRSRRRPPDGRGAAAGGRRIRRDVRTRGRMIDKGRVGASILLDTIESYRTVLTSDQREWLRGRVSSHFNRRTRTPNPRLEAHAAGKAHAAYDAAGVGGSYPYPRDMNVVITLADAARTFAYRGLNALAGKLREIAVRIAPDR